MIALPSPTTPRHMSDTDLSVINTIIAQTKAETAPAMRDDDFWEFFTANQLLRDYQLSPDDIESGLVGQGFQKDDPKESDGGIDSMYLLINGVLIRDLEQAKALVQKKGILFDIVIIQSKLGTGFTLDALNRLSNTCESIFRTNLQPEDFSEKYNRRLLDIIRLFRAAHTTLITRQPEINVSIFYAARSDVKTLNDTQTGKARELERKIVETLATVTKCEFHFKGARELIELWNKPRKFRFPLTCTHCISDGKGGWIALVGLGEYYKLITEGNNLREYLFESNVRDYEGEAAVNQQIRSTLDAHNDTAAFWWLNNGITIIAQDVTGGAPELGLLTSPWHRLHYDP